jgi:osmotically-inducible protein OsmY
MIKTANRRIAALLCAVATVGVLQGCAPLLLGGAFVGTGMLATDRRTSGTVVEDEGIELKAAARIRENLGDRVHVNITSYNRQVLISGEVPNAQDKQLVEKVVAGVDNVRNIVNELDILGNSTLGQRSSDVVVSSRVKARLVDATDLSANAFKIVTERGVVYVMGRVTQREANRATDIISSTSGVQRVVRMLETITEEELARLVPPRAPESSAPGATRQ